MKTGLYNTLLRKFLIVAVLLLSGLSAFAQSQMTDAQIVSYVKKEQNAGTSQAQIVTKLMQKGVSVTKIQQLRRQYADILQKDENKQTIVGNRSRVVNKPSTPSVSADSSTDEGNFDVLSQRMLGQEEETAENSASVKKVFGRDIFNNKNLSFEPNMNIATPQNYVLGPGDAVYVDIYGASQKSLQSTVSPDGYINIEGYGPVQVSGLTVKQASARLRSTLGSRYSSSSIKLTLGQTKTIMVNVMGEVKVPGTYTLSAFASVFHALYMAGGTSDIGTLREIKVFRRGKQVASVDVYDYILNGKLSGNVMLHDNDVIMVGPYENLVKVEGCVKRPMYYEMKKNESLKSLITFAGGFTGDAYQDKIRVERNSSDGLTVHNVEEWDFSSFRNADGDVVVIAPVIERYKNTVVVSGAVFRPGKYRIDDKVNTVKTIVEQAGGLMEQAVLSRAVLFRMKEDRTHTTLAIDLKAIMDGNTPDIPLKNEDELIISSNAKLMSSHTFTISGEVMNPGTYPFSDNTTIEDLITIAGGLTESASLDQVEISRRITSADDNADGNQMAKVFKVNLKNGLGMADGSNFKLLPFDNVTVHRNPNYKEQKNVYIGGEVQYAGFYAITSKEERLSDIVKRAGGLTNKAYVKGARLIRRYTSAEIRNHEQLIEMAQNQKDSLDAYAAMDKTTYSVGIDLAKALDSSNGENDIILEDGDSISIPQMSNVVKISGEVLSPNTVTYMANKGASYYLDQAGGVTETGRKRKAYILYANGQISPLSKGNIEPGCEIVVPSKVEKKRDPAKVGMWTTVASTAATVGAVVSSIVK